MRCKILASMYLLFFFHCTESFDYDGSLQIEIDHSLNCDGATFCPRGKITVQSVRTGVAVIDQNPLSTRDQKNFKELAEQDGFYTIRAIVSSDEIKNVPFFSSVKAQKYLESNYEDSISTWVLPSGGVIGINLHVTNSTLKHKSIEGYKPFVTKLYLRHIDQAPVPDTASYIQKVEREREARDRGELKDNRSFLAKYWMYIVPVVIFLMISSAANPDVAASH